jgi:hypothetical protein
MADAGERIGSSDPAYVALVEDAEVKGAKVEGAKNVMG